MKAGTVVRKRGPNEPTIESSIVGQRVRYGALACVGRICRMEGVVGMMV